LYLFYSPYYVYLEHNGDVFSKKGKERKGNFLVGRRSAIQRVSALLFRASEIWSKALSATSQMVTHIVYTPPQLGAFCHSSETSLTLKMTALRSFEMSIATHPVTQHHISEDQNNQFNLLIFKSHGDG